MEQVLIVVLGAAALLARGGQALYAAGLSRSKNSAGAVLRTACDFCAATLAYWAVGAALLFQAHNGFLGLRPRLLFGWEGFGAEQFLYLPLILIATGAVAGAVAERSRFFPLCAVSAVLAGVIIPVAGAWIWQDQGWLQHLGFLDVAGASALHLSAGVCAAVGAAVVGPRTGKYNRDGSTNMIPGHSVPLAGIGALLMLAAWVPYVAGLAAPSARGAGHAAANVLLAAAAAGLAALLVARVRYGKPDVLLALLGLLGGLVAITAGAETLGTIGAVLTGAIAGLLVPTAAILLDLFARLDDPAGAVAVHGVGGAWGVLAAGLFTSPGGIGEWFRHVGVQLVGLIAVAVWAGAVSVGVWLVLKATVSLRASEADEYDGLDLAEHDIGAYPDFQQTMIKSYHLREA